MNYLVCSRIRNYSNDGAKYSQLLVFIHQSGIMKILFVCAFLQRTHNKLFVMDIGDLNPLTLGLPTEF
jgi:hypothetical protein